MGNVKPISPQEALKYSAIPDAVIEAWNNLIVRFRRGRCSIVPQNEALAAIQKAQLEYTGLTYSIGQIIDNGWLEIEEIYRNAGWTVKYDRPAYNETYTPVFIFTAPAPRLT